MSVHALIGRRVIHLPTGAECRVLAAQLFTDEDGDPVWDFLIEDVTGQITSDYAHRFKMKRPSVKSDPKRVQNRSPMVLSEDDSV